MAITVTVIDDLGLSQPFTVWLTYHVKLPAVVVEGTGAVAEPTPPTGTVYHNRFCPVAVNAVAASPSQYVGPAGTTGAEDEGLDNAIGPTAADVQLFTVTLIAV